MLYAPTTLGLGLVLAVGALAAENRTPVILISVDTLRADHVGCYGSKSKAPPTSHIDAIAREGTRFSNISAQVPLTLPSHACLLTSTYPFSNGVRDNGQALGTQVSTLAGVLKQHGYRTGAVVASYVLDRRFGLNRGFDEYDDRLNLTQAKTADPGDVKRLGEDVIRVAVEWLHDKGATPFFLFVHLYDLHTPYRIPGRRQHLSYNDALTYEDTVVGEFWEALVRQQITDHALIVFTSDHGEGLGNHGESTHGFFIYQSTLQVPLIAHWPSGSSHPAVVTQPAGLIDVAPTILQFLGIEQPASFQGRSLIGVLTPGARDHRTTYSESLYAQTHFGSSSLRSVQDAEYKFIESSKPELYDLSKDPLEERNLYKTEPALAAAYRQKLRNIALRFGGPKPTRSVEPEAVAKLRSLGYLAGTTNSVNRFTSGAAPSDRIADYELYGRALALTYSGHGDDASAILEKLLKMDGNLPDVHLSLGMIRRQQGNDFAATEEFGAVLKQDPANALAHFHLGGSLASLGQHEQARKEFEAALAIEPYYTRSEEMLAGELLGEKRLGDAKNHFEHILQVEPANFGAHYNLGVLAAMDGKNDEARKHLMTALSTNPQSAEAHNALGSIELRQGELTPAEQEFDQAIRLSPKFSMAHYNLGLVLRRKGDHAGALREFRIAVEADPHNQEARKAALKID